MNINLLNDKKNIIQINKILSRAGILDIIKNDSSVYIGGSLPAFIISKILNDNDDNNEVDGFECNDIDLYTNNYVI